MDKEQILNIIIVLLFILLFAFVIGLTVGYFWYKNQQCIADPLVFAANSYKDAYGYEFEGVGYLKVPPNYHSVVVLFNSTDQWLLNG